MSIENEMIQLVDTIDHELKIILDGDYSHQAKIFESMNYSLFTGGKRLRPIMLLKTYSMFKEDIQKVIPFALAIEMIHTYSLVHDDLPSMDDDDLRRGKPTNHKVFGEAIAILTGDGLLNLAFETMSNYIVESSNTIDDYKRTSRAMAEIAKCSGVYGMIGGQVVDLLGCHDNMEEDKLFFMYKLKTAALIQCSIVAGALLGGASEEEINKLREFGLNLGLAYQIRDDLLDHKEDSLIDKITYLRHYNKDKAKRKVQDLSNRALMILEELTERDSSFLEQLTSELISREV